MFGAILTSKLGLAGIALGLVLMLFGIQEMRLHHAKADLTSLREGVAKAEKQAAGRERAAQAISVASASQLASQRLKIVTRTRTLVEKVPVYVDANADAACAIGTGFVSVFNAAARGEAELPRPPGGSGGSPSGVPLSAVLSATVEDFGIAYDWREEALSWRAWYAAQAKAWNAK